MADRDFQENYFLVLLGLMITFAGLFVFVSVLITGSVVLAFLGGDRSDGIVSGLFAGPLFIGFGTLMLWGLIKFAKFVQRRGVVRRPGAPRS